MKIGFYPEYVNENAARLIASIIVILTTLSMIFPETYLFLLLNIGFIARTLYGPKYSLAARLVTRIIIPYLNISFKQVPGPPKRFAQLIGILFSTSASILFFQGLYLEYSITLGILLFFASLEAFFGFCAGCFVFGLLMKIGVIPDQVCERCNNINFGENI